MKKTKIGKCIYIMTNPSFPDYVKIGYSDNVNQRLKELNRSECIPFAFRIYAVYAVDSRVIDKEIHDMIDQLNPQLRSREEYDGKLREREFYLMSAKEAFQILEHVAKVSGTTKNLIIVDPTDEQKKEEKLAYDNQKTAKAKRMNFSFKVCKIKNGSKVEYARDKKIKCTVSGDNKIKYKNKEYTLTGLAKKLLKKDIGIAGPHFFKYKGKLLSDIMEDAVYK